MSKTVQTVKNSLKFKAQEKEGLLTVRFGVKKFVLPVAARMLCDGKYMFLSFGASSELYEINGKGLTAMDKDADADAAFEALNVTKRRGRPRKNSEAAISPELQKLLSESDGCGFESCRGLHFSPLASTFSGAELWVP